MSNSIIFQPDPNTAITIDTIVKQLSNMQRAEEIFIALCEFAMGIFDTSHTCDICYGFNRVSAMNSQMDIVIGQGIYRLDGGDVPLIYPPDTTQNPYRVFNYSFEMFEFANYSLENYYMTEFPIDVRQALSGMFLQNTYVFGSVYFSNNSNPKLGLQLLVGETGMNYMIMRDIPEKDIVDMVVGCEIPETTGMPTDAVELAKIVISVEYFSGIPTDSSNRLNVIWVDKRMPRGWAGFAEENFSSVIAPALLRYRNNLLLAIETNASGKSIEDTIAVIVADWKALNWPGGFDEFWTGSSSIHRLPGDLYSYIYG